MKRIIIHWTAGTHKASSEDRQHYHFVVEGDGNVVAGIHPPEANLSTADGNYATHTLKANTGAIGVAVAAMGGATERPFSAGKWPITQRQMIALAGLCADICATYRIAVTRETVLTHAEVEPTLGIKQRGKWDITWVPGLDAPDAPVKVGDWIRALIKGAHTPPVRPDVEPVEPVPPSSRGGPAAAVMVAIGAAAAALWKWGCDWLPWLFANCGG